jgi:cytochrome bd ubiquinol oxidase, subunit I
VWISVIGFTLVYLILAVVWFYLMRRYTAVGLRPADKEPLPEFKDDDNDGYPDYAHDENGDPTPLSFAY